MFTRTFVSSKRDDERWGETYTVERAPLKGRKQKKGKRSTPRFDSVPKRRRIPNQHMDDWVVTIDTSSGDFHDFVWLMTRQLQNTWGNV